MMKTILTIFTPAYNRAHTIGRTYESLCRQSCKDFKWLIIDDGSTDDTDKLAHNWQQIDNGFPINYIWKENGGLHTGYNKAIELIDTELCVCIDSDDYMPDDAVEKILDCWNEHASEDVAGIIGLDYLPSNYPLGGPFPQVEKCHSYELDFKYDHNTDVKYVTRTELLKKVSPQPTFYGEKNFNPHYMFIQIDLRYKWVLLNENLCFVDYQPDGMANNIYKQYLNSPNSFAAQRLLNLKIPAPLTFYLKQSVHLCSSAILSGNYFWIMRSSRPFLTILALPFGFVFSLFVRFQNRNR